MRETCPGCLLRIRSETRQSTMEWAHGKGKNRGLERKGKKGSKRRVLLLGGARLDTTNVINRWGYSGGEGLYQRPVTARSKSQGRAHKEKGPWTSEGEGDVTGTNLVLVRGIFSNNKL